MAFTGKKHSKETKAKIAASMSSYQGKKHPRSGAEWTDRQRVKYDTTIMEKQKATADIISFLMAYQEGRELFKTLPTESKIELFLKHYQNKKHHD